MRHRTDHIFGELPQIDRQRDIERYRVETGDAEQLLDQPIHPRDLFFESRNFTIALERVEAGSYDSQRRSQLMRRIGSEPALSNKALLQPVERMIDGSDKRQRLGWNTRLR